MKRIVVIGTSCSGKTTFGAKLSQLLKAPNIELDDIHWRPGWIEIPDEEMRELVVKEVEQESWVVVGNYGFVRDIIWRRADTIIWLNYPFRIVLYRALKRTLRRVIIKDVICNGNVETFKRSFMSRDSILLWVLQTYHRGRRNTPQLLKNPENDHLQVIEFRHPEEAEEFLKKKL
ncbi:MAG TPA: adenylate kinase [Patescibacteria group bacterium]|nr:adenylate kinase [Patescibacteria group bacterium]